MRIAAAIALAGVLGIALMVSARPAVADEPAPAPTTTVAEQPTAPLVEQPTAHLPLREGAVGSRVHLGQVRLQWLGYAISDREVTDRFIGPSTMRAVRAFQEKFNQRETGVIGAGTWARLAKTAGRVGGLPTACRGERTVCINLSQRLVRLVVHDDVVLTLDARFGVAGDNTSKGTFRVHWKSRDHTSSRYRTWMPFAVFFSGDQALHYSPYFARDGYHGGSHGCVNLRDFDKARFLFNHVAVGTRVHVYA